MTKDSLAVTDNRTGRSYEIPISDGTVRAIDFRQMNTPEDDFGLMVYDPAVTNPASCRSPITYIDGERGVLEYRGYPIDQLAENTNFLETAYLILFGELPTRDELDQWTHDITYHTYVHENIKKFMEGFQYDAHPMGMLVGTVAALSTFYPDAKHADAARPRGISPGPLLARLPAVPAFASRHSRGLPSASPDNDLSYAGHSPSMLWKIPEPKYRPDPAL